MLVRGLLLTLTLTLGAACGGDDCSRLQDCCEALGVPCPTGGNISFSADDNENYAAEQAQCARQLQTILNGQPNPPDECRRD